MTIYEIKKRLGPATHYFDKAEMRFFKQSLRDFTVKKIAENKYHIYAPSYWDGRLMGISQRIYNADTNRLEDVPDNMKI